MGGDSSGCFGLVIVNSASFEIPHAKRPKQPHFYHPLTNQPLGHCDFECVKKYNCLRLSNF